MLRGPKQEADKSKFYNQIKPKKEFEGRTPNILIGSWGYPFVGVGALSPEDKQDIDDPKKYVRENTDINKIIQQRQSLINSKLVLPIKRLNEKFVELFGDGLFLFICAMCGWSNDLFYGLFVKIGARVVKEAEKEIGVQDKED